MLVELFSQHRCSRYLDMKCPDTVQEIVDHIHITKRLPIHRITLVFNGYILQPSATTAEYHITDASKVRLILPVQASISSLSQYEGPSFGGASISIVGSFPYSGRRYKVSFGTSEAIASFENSRMLKVITPPHEPAVVDVTVCYEGGEPSNGVKYTYTSFDCFNRKMARCADTPTFSLKDAVHRSVE